MLPVNFLQPQQFTVVSSNVLCRCCKVVAPELFPVVPMTVLYLCYLYIKYT
jgi:hypothetical protein